LAFGGTADDKLFAPVNIVSLFQGIDGKLGTTGGESPRHSGHQNKKT